MKYVFFIFLLWYQEERRVERCQESYRKSCPLTCFLRHLFKSLICSPLPKTYLLQSVIGVWNSVRNQCINTGHCFPLTDTIGEAKLVVAALPSLFLPVLCHRPLRVMHLSHINHEIDIEIHWEGKQENVSVEKREKRSTEAKISVPSTEICLALSLKPSGTLEPLPR